MPKDEGSSVQLPLDLCMCLASYPGSSSPRFSARLHVPSGSRTFVDHLHVYCLSVSVYTVNM